MCSDSHTNTKSNVKSGFSHPPQEEDSSDATLEEIRCSLEGSPARRSVGGGGRSVAREEGEEEIEGFVCVFPAL
ncbi:hypothetical protein NC651_037426 [Populus alba x Populus x berolinensis]|nr:hypothetical protein NC651_037426 [Populus alba x Populus x berolinensis]